MKRQNINKNQLLKEIKSNLGLPLNICEKILSEIFEIISDGLNNDQEIKINGFGKFKLLNKRSRYGRNPKTGEEYKIKARKVVTFYPSINIKKKINNEK